MKRKTLLRFSITALIIVLGGWFLLTLWVERAGPAKYWRLGKAGGKRVLVTFDPDPFYNLDEQVSRSFGLGLASKGYDVTVATVSACDTITRNFDLYAFCANTYNWRPDWAVTGFIETHQPSLTNAKAVAITLGAGSTTESKAHLEKILTNAGANIVGSKTLWLWRPNDKQRMEEPNTRVANDLAFSFGEEIAANLENH